MRINQGLRAAATGGGGVTTDPNFRNTVLLLNGDGTNGAQNNTFVDSSTNNFTITRNGNVTQGSFSPYGDRWSAFFDGTGDYLSIPDSNTWAFAGDFTVEAWVYPTSLGAERIIISQWFGGTTANTAFTIDFQSTNKVRAIFSSGGTMATINSSSTYTANAWYHISAVRSGSTITLYVNGLNEGTVTLSGAINNIAYPLYIGALNNQGALASPFVGYISNARILKGTALYTSNFTPPTSPLTAITNTSLLTCHANRFMDGSSNNFTITRNGDTRVERFSPFAPSAAYSTSVIGGSAYFDGSGDFLNTAPGTSTTVNDFSMSGWVYRTSAPATGQAFGNIGRDGSGRIVFYWENSNLRYDIFASSNVAIDSTGKMPVNEWVYVVITRTGSSLSAYYNGQLINTVTLSGTLGNTTGAYNWADALTGYISDYRIDNAAHPSPTVVPASPVSTTASTRLLVSATNAGIINATAGNVLETVGNAQVSTVQKKYGTGALYFDGSGDWLIAPNNVAYSFGTSDFTIEAWVWLDSTVAPGRVDNLKTCSIFTTGSSTAGTDALSFAIYGTTTTAGIGLEVYQEAPRIALQVAAPVSTNTWVHIAWTKVGSTFYGFVNGTRYTLGTSTLAIGTSTIPTVGRSAFSNFPNVFKGYIDDLRITKGVARYTANFTPPTAALPLL